MSPITRVMNFFKFVKVDFKGNVHRSFLGQNILVDNMYFASQNQILETLLQNVIDLAKYEFFFDLERAILQWCPKKIVPLFLGLKYFAKTYRNYVVKLQNQILKKKFKILIDLAM